MIHGTLGGECMDVCREAVLEWGLRGQLLQMIEEAGEFVSAAVQREFRGRTDGSTIEEELADLELGAEQMHHGLDHDAIEGWKVYKRYRLENLIRKARGLPLLTTPCPPRPDGKP